jgi:amino acid permease
MNETAITIIGLLLLFAAMGKSAQLGLNTWLPHSMEGRRFFNKKNQNLIFIMVIMFITILCLIESSVQLDSMIYQLAIPPILAQIPRSTLEAMTF